MDRYSSTYFLTISFRLFQQQGREADAKFLEAREELSRLKNELGHARSTLSTLEVYYHDMRARSKAEAAI